MSRTTFSGPVASDNGFLSTITNTSTGSSTFEASVTDVTMTGAGGLGGRTRFQLNANAALGSYSNALKAITVYGASGRTTGLGSAFVAEMTLSAGTTAGTYAPVEIELNLGTGAQTGTATSLMYASVNGAAAGTFDSNGFFFNLAGLTAGSTKCLQTGTTFANPAATLKCKVGSTTYYLPLYDGQITT